MEQHDEMPVVVRPPIEQPPEIIDIHAPGTNAEPPTPEQARMADAHFGRREKESDAAAAVMALWVAGAVLPDMFRDMTEKDDEEEDDPAKKKPELPRK